MSPRSDDIKSWAVSIGVHALLLLIAFIWTVQTTIVTIHRPVEVVLLQSEPATPHIAYTRSVTPRTEAAVTTPRVSIPKRSESPSTARNRAQSRSTAQNARSAAAQSSKNTGSAAERGTTTTPSPPERMRTPSMFESSDFGVKEGKEKTDPTANTTPGGKRDTRESQLPSAGKERSSESPSNKGALSATPGDEGRDATPSTSSHVDWGGGLARSRIAGAMPVFPKDATREARISVRFTVKPNGAVTGISFLQKGEPRYEQAVLAAMRGWRFTKLPENLPQQDQTATATFYFKLK